MSLGDNEVYQTAKFKINKDKLLFQNYQKNPLAAHSTVAGYASTPQGHPQRRTLNVNLGGKGMG